MYATTVASLALHACFSARPRPLRSRCTAHTCGRSRAKLVAANHVSSVDALSTIVRRQENGKLLREIGMQTLHARCEAGRLVVDRDHNVEDGRYRTCLVTVAASRCTGRVRHGA